MTKGNNICFKYIKAPTKFRLILRGFTQSFQANRVMVAYLKIGNDNFLRCPFQFSIHNYITSRGWDGGYYISYCISLFESDSHVIAMKPLIQLAQIHCSQKNKSLKAKNSV
jgi:hypothetical protein